MSTHEARPGPFSAERSHQIDDRGLSWRVGQRSGHVAFADIAGLRVNLTGGGGLHYSVCVITERSGRRHHVTEGHKPGFFKPAERRTDSFMAFTRAAVSALPQANPAAELTRGPGRGEWITAIFVLLVIAAMTLAGIALMVAHGRIAWAALAFIGVLLSMAPSFWPIAMSGGPKPLDAQAWLASQPAAA